jgi:hypothetical protein
VYIAQQQRKVQGLLSLLFLEVQRVPVRAPSGLLIQPKVPYHLVSLMYEQQEKSKKETNDL